MFVTFRHQFGRMAPVVAILLLLTGVAAAADKTITLSKDSVIEIVFVDLKDAQKDVFFNDYLSKVEPIIESHGGKVKAKFETFDVVEGDITPQYVLLLEWPSVDAFDDAVKDGRAARYLPLREQSTRALHLGLFTIQEDASFTLQEGVVYEFFAGNPASPKAPEMLGQFFQKVIPTAMEYGRGTLLELKPVNYAGDNYDRMIAGVATWPSATHFYQFTNTTVFREGVREFRDPALTEQEIINTYFVSE